ncbi:MAG: UDP-N-acetylglucosamine 1-carboxyvinyltransferase [Verrucomicrobia bacterium]|nr:UDP-N-acetylglucosamine 1-carboxyvinyltransferase [Verrucomicrobiota bacterium]
MEKMIIEGGDSLRGEVRISGAKNAALPIMAAALLTPEECVIRNVPQLQDVRFMTKILQALGAEAELAGDAVRIRAVRIGDTCDYDLVRKMRGSVCVLGPLSARLGRARVALPGGCVIGARPIDLHLKGMEALGAQVAVRGGYVHTRADRLAGREIFLSGRAGPTVLGTANVMMAATLAEGVTVIQGAACEPEVADLAKFLAAMGAKIEGAGSPTIVVTGVPGLHGAEHELIPDRIEAATFAVAAAATGGEVALRGARPDHMSAVLDKLREIGVETRREGERFLVRPAGPLRPAHITTHPYPGFPTDVQAQMTALLTQADGISIVTERIFESRFMHISELARMGAKVYVEGPHAIIHGPNKLSGAEVMASDLRASAALVIAGLMAEGRTEVRRIYHLDRGYERIDEKLTALGARVKRAEDQGP